MLVAVPRPEYHCHGHPIHSVAVRSHLTQDPAEWLTQRIAPHLPAHKD